MTMFPEALKKRRRERRMSQLDLSLEAEVSARHVAFMETGRANPSRAMVLRLAEALRAPLEDRNILLAAAGFTPEFPRHALDDAALSPVREAMSRLLERQEPYPAMVFDRRWRLLEANRAATRLFGPVLAREDRNLIAAVIESPAIREMIENWSEVGPEMLARLKLERVYGAADPELDAQVDRFATLVAETCGDASDAEPASDALFVNPRFRLGEARLSMFSTIAQFGAPREITISDLRIELFFPLDPESDALLQAMAAAG